MNKATAALKLAEEAMTSNMRLLGAKALAAIREVLAEPVCEHRIADARNEFVRDGYICIKCGALFRAADHAKPVKQEEAKIPVEPVAERKEQVNQLIKESARLIGSIKDEGDQYLTAIDALRNAYRIGLKDSPVDAKAIRAEALEEAAKLCEQGTGDAIQTETLKLLLQERGRIASVIRGLKLRGLK